MKSANFPGSRMILPCHRLNLSLQKNQERRIDPERMPTHDDQQLQEFQRLIEQSFCNGLVIRIVSVTDISRLITTGIVKNINPRNGHLVVQTLEGPRTITAAHIREISE